MFEQNQVTEPDATTYTNDNPMFTTEQVLQKAQQDNIKFVNLVFTDIQGMIKSVTVPVEQLRDSLEHGTWFDGSSIEGFTRISESDMYLKPDPNTYAILPWRSPENVTLRLICDVYTPDGKPFEGDPRYILKKTMQEAEQMGFTLNVGPELEFFIFKKKDGEKLIPHDTSAYFDFAPKDAAASIRSDIFHALKAMGIYVEMSHHEVGPGQHEIDFKYDDALRTADNAITFKHVVKTIAKNNNLHATFMPKPLVGENGSGMHTHLSLADKNTGENLFHGDSQLNLSELGQQFVAGLIKHIQALSAIMSPTVNSYKRLVPGYEAPVYVCWGQKNRSALIRVPRVFAGRKQATRIELRCPDTSCNPYLAFAVMLKAGLEGIKHKMVPPPPVEEDVYQFSKKDLESKNIPVLPQTLGHALNKLEKDEIIKDALGLHAYQAFMRAKKAEWDEFRLQVTDWEINKYYDNY